MEWFDCHAWFGVPVKSPVCFFATAEELIEEMDFCGAGDALVYHTSMLEDAPEVGNPRVVEETARQARLHPTWAILPAQTGELGTVDEFLAGMKTHGVKALRAYPEENRYLLNGVTFGPLLEELTARRIPLLVGPNWRMVTDVLAEFPGLTLIVVRHGSWGDDRYFRPLMERYERLYVDTSRYQLDHGIVDFVGKYGPDRLLYGSAAPELQMGAGMLMLAHADIEESAKAAIAGGNLRRLLGEVKL
jgi:hypothetical protein